MVAENKVLYKECKKECAKNCRALHMGKGRARPNPVGRPRKAGSNRVERPKKMGYNRLTGRVVYRRPEDGRLIEYVYPKGKSGGRVARFVEAANLVRGNLSPSLRRKLRDRDKENVVAMRFASRKKKTTTRAPATPRPAATQRIARKTLPPVSNTPVSSSSQQPVITRSQANGYVHDAFSRLMLERGPSQTITVIDVRNEIRKRHGIDLPLALIKEIITG